MVTFAQAQERAEEWVNGDVPAYQHREVRVREFGLGFVVWAEDRADGPRSDGGAPRLVIARDSGDATLWPGLPVGEVIRRYEEEYGRAGAVAGPAPAAARVDLNQTSFLLSPPQWLQEAADKLGIADRRRGSGAADAAADPEPVAGADATGGSGSGVSGAGSASAGAAPVSGAAWPAAEGTEGMDAAGVGGGAGAGAPVVPPGATPWAGTDTNGDGGEDRSVPLPETVFAPQLDDDEAAGVADVGGRDAAEPPGAIQDAGTAKLTRGGGLPRTAGGPVGAAATAPAPGSPSVPPVPGAPSPASAPPPMPAAGPQPPHAPGVPGAPGGASPGGVHQAATMLAGPGGTPPPPGVPHPPAPPGAPGAAGGQAGVHHVPTVLAAPPVGGPGTPPPAPGVPAPGVPAPGVPQGAVPPSSPPPAYGYPPRPAGQPTVGPGYQAVLRYRAQDGSEQQLIRRSAPGTPHPEWQIYHELRAMNVPPDQVLELHTELESCELPGAYCARMIREQWPQARITSIAPYGTDHASRQQGMAQLISHQGELHQVADGPARPAPVRAPLPSVPPAPPLPPEGIAQELAAAFGPGVFRFEQAAVSRQGVPPVVAHTLVVAGLPVDMGPFFWAQAQPGRPVPTLAELAAERGVRPASDAGSYLVVGSDFGKAICVQYGTANIVAVPVEAGPGGAPVPPQFVNTGLPEFARALALLGRMWRLRYGLNQEQAGRWTVDFQAQLAALDAVALGSPESWWSVLLEEMWDGLL
ncbi:SUKH-4 family immunity protein [Streptomyces sp. NPDC023723]|uniref:SUKH-4 family immunity protein n=1 Tax=Streptomyces sp. NPDC023723 TaxID=3154323 RepID=UPI0033F241F3